MTHQLPLPGVQELEWSVLARDRVRFVGEPIAAVVATSRAIAEDALDLIEVDDEPLPVVVDPFDALAPGASLLYPEWGTNEFFRMTVLPDALDEAIVRRAARAARPLHQPPDHRPAARRPRHAGRARSRHRRARRCIASTQQPHQLRTVIAETCGLSEHDGARRSRPTWAAASATSSTSRARSASSRSRR